MSLYSNIFRSFFCTLKKSSEGFDIGRKIDDRLKFVNSLTSSLLSWLLGAASKYFSPALSLATNHVLCLCFEQKLLAANVMEFTATLFCF